MQRLLAQQYPDGGWSDPRRAATVINGISPRCQVSLCSFGTWPEDQKIFGEHVRLLTLCRWAQHRISIVPTARARSMTEAACQNCIGTPQLEHVSLLCTMPGSTISVFSEPDDFQTALRSPRSTELLVTEAGQFWARLTRVALHDLWLTAADERLSRVAVISLPPGLVRITWTAERGELVLGGIKLAAGDVVTHCSSYCLHERITGHCGWRDITIPARLLKFYSRALVGAPIVVPPGVRLWRPPGAALRRLIALHAAATRVANAQPGRAATAEAAHGLEQEIIEVLVESLSGKPTNTNTSWAERDTELAIRFERLIQKRLRKVNPATELCACLNVAGRTLRACCHRQLGMGPQRYLRLRRMQLARRALRTADPGVAIVSRVALHYGFRDLGRFSSEYREVFGELPSATLRHGMGG